MKNEYLQPLFVQAEATAKKIQTQFGSLSEAQLNWKPNPASWSVGQCIDHLIVTNRQYFRIFDNIRQGQHTKTFFERLPFLPSFFGNMILKSVHPDTQRKNKTFPVFEPAQSNIPADIVRQFRKVHDKLIAYIKASDQLNHQKVIVASPVSNYITYSLQHVCKIIVVHEERHYNQARRVMDHEAFPKSPQ